MRLICPSCFAIASLEAWANDANCRQFLDVVVKLPAPVASRCPAYFGLFRKGQRGLSWQRALRIATELQELVSKGSVHWEGSEERPAPPDLWAVGMEKVLASRPEALEGHNYLRKIVWSDAAPLAAKAETKLEADRLVSHQGEAGKAPEPVKQTCFTCGAFKPPNKCTVGQKPVSGNLMMGCRSGHWTHKPAAVSDLFQGILGKIVSSEE